MLNTQQNHGVSFNNFFLDSYKYLYVKLSGRYTSNELSSSITNIAITYRNLFKILTASHRLYYIVINRTHSIICTKMIIN